MPLVAQAGSSSAQMVRIALPELTTRVAHHLVRGGDTSRIQELFHITEAERVAMVEPDGVDDNLLREAEALVGHRHSGVIHTPSIAQLTVESVHPSLSCQCRWMHFLTKLHTKALSERCREGFLLSNSSCYLAFLWSRRGDLNPGPTVYESVCRSSRYVPVCPKL